MAGLQLNTDLLRLLLFGGKGGTGKTTSAAAAAIHLARQIPAKKVLLVSTDPAHSLTDSLGAPGSDDRSGDEFLRDGLTLLAGFENLWLWELNAQQADRRYRAEHEGAIKALASRGTFLDDQDIDSFWRLPLPGLDEVMAIIEIANLLKAGRYDLIVVDTAPTGHTLRLLSMPDEMKRWLHVLGLMQRKHRFLMKRFTGRCVGDDADAFLATTAADIARLRDLLRDREATEFVPVTIPEPLSICETERLLSALCKHGIAVRNLIVNRVPGGDACPFCCPRREKAAPWLAEIAQRFAACNIVKVPLSAGEIRGPEALGELGGRLFSDGVEPLLTSPGGVPPGQPIEQSRQESRLEGLSRRRTNNARTACDLLRNPRKFLLFGGKGGVGKTSLAAATALLLGDLHPDRRILVLSTDPAHSLGDSLATPVGDRITRIGAQGQISALEINSERLMERFRAEYRESIEAIFARFTGGADIKFDREVMRELISMAPPGLEELMALVEVMSLADQYDQFVLDTAPTGHLIRFLEMPDLAHGWIKAILKVLLKHKSATGLGEPAQKLVNLSRDVQRIKTLLTDPQQCEFVAVTIPEAMGLAETRRLLVRLDELGMPCRHIVVNMVMPESDCAFCREVREQQTDYLRQAAKLRPRNTSAREVSPPRASSAGWPFRRRVPPGPRGGQVIEAPLFPHQISGIEHLRKLADAVYARRRSLLSRVTGVL